MVVLIREPANTCILFTVEELTGPYNIMPKLNLRRLDVLIILFLVANLHILLTYFCSIRAGTHSVEDITEAVRHIPDRMAILAEASRDKYDQAARKSRNYEISLFVLSLPFEPVFRPLRQRWMVEPLLDGSIGVDAFKVRATILNITTMILNSIVFTILAYWGLKAAARKRNNRKMRKAGPQSGN